MSTNLKTLISKLNVNCRQATERAVNLCISHGHYEVEFEHLFLALLEHSRGDLAIILERNEISQSRLVDDLQRKLATFKRGNIRTPVFSIYLPKLLEHAWLLASIDSEISCIRSGHLLLALLTANELSQLAHQSSSLFSKIAVDELKYKLTSLTLNSNEVEQSIRISDQDHHNDDTVDKVPSQSVLSSALNQFTINLTQQARDGKVDPVVGRELEIRQIIDILLRRRQNNPILTGEAGVGKTAVVEGLAQRIALGDVPLSLATAELHMLDMGLLQAGASVKGEFENRLKNVIDEVKRSSHPIILFIDEAHTIIGAGGQAGQNDAANLLKPALARGEIRTIAATTWAEYKKYFEKDTALARRFQVVKVEEPSIEIACAMLRGMVPFIENHFDIKVLDSAVTEAVRLSARYITGRQLPDKAISVLDTACARVALARNTTPAPIEDIQKQLERISCEINTLENESRIVEVPIDHLNALITMRTLLNEDLQRKNKRLLKEREIVKKIAQIMKQLDLQCLNNKQLIEKIPASERAETLPLNTDFSLHSLQLELKHLQGILTVLQDETPLIPICVDHQVVGEVISSWTGIPLGKMVKNEINAVLTLDTQLRKRVMGQDHALQAVAKSVQTARANLEDPNKPQGVFLLVGPSGVGKTETALALADVLYGGERNMITINMSEFQEAHSVSSLKGSPPGYVGYGEGGVLTEAVRQRPYSVVLLDEIEKAHSDVLEMFFQIFDKGMMDDSEGREIDFKNTLILMTSNVASPEIMKACMNKDFDCLPKIDALEELIRPSLYKVFKPAFLGRMKVIPYYPIPDEILQKIICLKLDRVKSRTLVNHKAEFSYDQALVDAVMTRCTEVDTGARNVDHIINGGLLPEIAVGVLAKMAEGKAIKKIKVGVKKSGQFDFRIS